MQKFQFCLEHLISQLLHLDLSQEHVSQLISNLPQGLWNQSDHTLLELHTPRCFSSWTPGRLIPSIWFWKLLRCSSHGSHKGHDRNCSVSGCRWCWSIDLALLSHSGFPNFTVLSAIDKIYDDGCMLAKCLPVWLILFVRIGPACAQCWKSLEKLNQK